MSNIKLINKAAMRVVFDGIPGDYLEFGTYQGRSVINAYNALKHEFDKYQNDESVSFTKSKYAARSDQWSKLRFFCFDSFEGLPELVGIDTESVDFESGQYACSKEQVEKNLIDANMEMSKVRLVPGWYQDSLTLTTKESLNIKSVAICWIDCDLYQSTKEVLDFIKDIIVDGTIIVFDDWFCFRGSPFRGQQRAFQEFQQELTDSFVFQEYQREVSTRLAFFCNKIID